jgi:hypothetical protein
MKRLGEVIGSRCQMGDGEERLKPPKKKSKKKLINNFLVAMKVQ